MVGYNLSWAGWVMKGLISVGKLSYFIPYHHVESPWRNSCQRLQPYSVSSTGVVFLSCKVYFCVPYTIIFAAGFNEFVINTPDLGKSDELVLHKTFSIILKDTSKLLKIKKTTTTNKQRQTKKKRNGNKNKNQSCRPLSGTIRSI